MNTILVIIILISVVFLLSNDKRLNEIVKNQSVPVLVLLLVFYFFFNKIDLRILCVIFIIVLLYFSKFCIKIRDHINLFLFNQEEENVVEENEVMNEIEMNNNKNELLQHLIDNDETEEEEESEDIELGTRISETQNVKEINDEMGDFFNSLNNEK